MRVNNREELEDALDEAIADIQLQTPLDLCLTNIGEHDKDPFGEFAEEVCSSDIMRGLQLTNSEQWAEKAYDILKAKVKEAMK